MCQIGELGSWRGGLCYTGGGFSGRKGCGRRQLIGAGRRLGASMPYTDYTPGEITARGEAIYLERIFPTLGRDEKGKFVSIDIESGDYEIDAEDPYAFQRLVERRPEGVFYGVRVGYWAPDGHPVSGFIGLGPRVVR